MVLCVSECVFWIIVLTFAAYGCAELTVRFMDHFLTIRKPRGVYVLSVKENEAECAVRSIIETKHCPVIVIDRGLDPEGRRILGLLQNEFPHLHICVPEDFEKIWNSCLQ